MVAKSTCADRAISTFPTVLSAQSRVESKNNVYHIVKNRSKSKSLLWIWTFLAIWYTLLLLCCPEYCPLDCISWIMCEIAVWLKWCSSKMKKIGIQTYSRIILFEVLVHSTLFSHIFLVIDRFWMICSISFYWFARSRIFFNSTTASSITVMLISYDKI